MKLNILIGGKAGQGINETANLLSRAIAKAGYEIFNYRDYSSRILGGHNFNVLCISDKKVGSFDKEYDIILAFDDKTIEIHKKEMKKGGVIIEEKDFEIKNLKIANMYFAGALFRILGLEIKFFLEEVEKKFKSSKYYEEDVKAIKEGYEKEFKLNFKLRPGKEKRMLNGNEAIAYSAIESGIEVYFGYPMTPATGVLTLLAQNQAKYGYFVFEPESELAVANASLGASYAGARTMTGTTGGGYDLMTEAFSMQGMTELPLVVHLSQRGGASTGIPTQTGQGDLNSALYAAHGEFARVVMAPGDAKEAWEKTNEAFYFAEKYGVLSMILTDKHLVESGYSFNELNKKRLKIPERKEYGGKGLFKRTSYEHDENWHSTEDPVTIKREIDKRLGKIKEIGKEAENMESYKVYGKGEKLVISFGSNKTTILDAMDELKDFKFIHVIYLDPFPKQIKKELEKAKKIISIEANAFGQFADLIKMKTGVEIEKKNQILKYDGQPFTLKELKEEINKR